jgi:hypothetical protein
MRLNDGKSDKIIDEIKQRMNQLMKTFDENQHLINEYENKDFIEHKSVQQLSHHLKRFKIQNMSFFSNFHIIYSSPKVFCNYFLN